MGLKEKCDARGGAESFQQVEQHGGLAHARLSNQTDESTIGLDAVIQRSQRFLMGFAEIKEARIRSNTEWLFAQSKKIKIHALPSRSDASVDKIAQPIRARLGTVTSNP